jgi:hypothetical protein
MALPVSSWTPAGGSRPVIVHHGVTGDVEHPPGADQPEN